MHSRSPAPKASPPPPRTPDPAPASALEHATQAQRAIDRGLPETAVEWLCRAVLALAQRPEPEPTRSRVRRAGPQERLLHANQTLRCVTVLTARAARPCTDCPPGTSPHEARFLVEWWSRNGIALRWANACDVRLAAVIDAAKQERDRG